MKKGDIFEGEIGRVDFPNKGHVTVDGEDVIVKMESPARRCVSGSIRRNMAGQRDGCWKCWRLRLWKPENRSAPYFPPAAAVCIRPWTMRRSWI